MSKEEPKKRGRPAYFETVEEMQKLIDDYFKKCDGEILTDVDGVAILDKYDRPIMVGQKPYTITGLTLALGFTSRQSLLNYQDKDEFMDAITRAKLQVEDYANTRLYDKDGVQGSKFTLINNFEGYNDKQAVEHSGEVGTTINIIPASVIKK